MMISAIKIETMEEERLLYTLITPSLPKRVKEQLLQVLAEYEEQRSI